MDRENIDRFIKECKRELKNIEKEYDVASWDYMDVSRMEAEEAYNRGYYRVLQQIAELDNN